MRVEILEIGTENQLLAKIRNVTMLTDKTVKPYEHAILSVMQMDTAHMAPAQAYVLKGEFEKVRDLRYALLKERIDILNLTSHKSYVKFITINDDGSKSSPITVLPPIIEDSYELDGSTRRIICDGQHRCFLARSMWASPYVLYIKDISIPYYAYPLRGGWDDVKVIDKLSPDIIKKFHRFEAYKAYYRDMNSVFEGVGGPRGNGSNA